MLLLVAFGARAQTDWHLSESSQVHMGVKVTISVYARTPEAGEAALLAGFDAVARIDEIASTYRAGSELNRLSARAGQGPGRASEELTRLLIDADFVARFTGGSFDPTVGPVSSLWREAIRTRTPPDLHAIESALPLVGHEMLVLDSRDTTIELTKAAMSLDLGGIAKGFAGDAALAAMSDLGVHRALIDLSGDIVAGDAPPDQPAWVVAVTTGLPGSPVIWSPLVNMAVATSGDAYQYIEVGGARHGHIVDPRTGMGCTNRAAACAFAPRGWIADALATAACVAGVDGVEAVRGGQELRFIARDADVTELPGPIALRIEQPEDAASGKWSLRSFEFGDFPIAGARGANRVDVEKLLSERAELSQRMAQRLMDGSPPPGFTALFGAGEEDLTHFQGLVELPTREKMTPAEREAAQADADKLMRAHWRVEHAGGVDGAMLVFDGKGQSLQTVKDYENFVLMLDWRIEAGGDSGVYLRGTPQVQIWDNPIGSGGLYNNQVGPSTPASRADKPVGEWNSMIIEMQGGVASVWLNGVHVVQSTRMENYWERGRPLPARGPIELQAHGSPLWFRNVYVRELP